VTGSAPIVTLTLNPAIDVSSEAETVRHTNKVRTRNEQIEPGGGGINVARVLSRLGADVCAIFLGGGITGRTLDDLLARSGINRTMIKIADDTRLSLTVVERSTGREYRFVPEGPDVTEEEAAAALDAAGTAHCDYLVASGSLSPGIPADFYVRLCSAVAARCGRFVLDTSGEALRFALEAGGIFLVKPSRGEFEAFVGGRATTDALVREAKALVDAGKAENIAITLGRDGAILVNRASVRISPAIKIDARSAVGAGDSFTAGMVYGFAIGKTAEDAFRYGLAAGAAAVLSSGSDLARPKDLERLVGAAESDEQM
jgi:6-phosphofructokinase 2